VAKQSKEQVELWRKKGEELISRSEVAIIITAGGLGTRLGFSKPKGLFVLNGLPSKKTLFQLHCEKIRRLEQNAKLSFPSCMLFDAFVCYYHLICF
jgi:UDP-N-acetylglucosamine/UDP-N-acetylgalactosamine diphosphorylase